jgi:aminopeptidase N
MKAFFLLFSLTLSTCFGQNTEECSNSTYRAWWDVQHYDLSVEILPNKASIRGNVKITFNTLDHPIDTLQLDLKTGLSISSVLQNKNKLKFERKNNHYIVFGNFKQLNFGEQVQLDVAFEGTPAIAKNPPWDGGFIRTTSANGKPWLAVACQGIGASAWWPCKDYPGDEPDKGVDLHCITTNDLMAIGNGLYYGKETKGKYSTYHWRVENPINLYDVTFYIGDYIAWGDTLRGRNGILSLNYYVLKENFEKSKKQFAVVKPMLHTFEYWLGHYPFYQDGYKLVDAPYLGMEHQSAIAYGNHYKMGYDGYDRSKTGIGLLFDFIIVHESAHEWFGNNISANDVAYSWIQEGFTTYCETIFAESQFGKDSAFQYLHGQWKIIKNKVPVEGKKGVCDSGSADQYEKGAALVHTIRQIIDNDTNFRALLNSLNNDFVHQTVDGKTFENYISRFVRKDLSKVFDQYLRTVQLPILVCKILPTGLVFRWENCVDGFNMPVAVWVNNEKVWIQPKDNTWTQIAQDKPITNEKAIKMDPNFLIGFAFKK